MTTGSLRRLAILAALLIVPVALGAGVNTWTGGRPVEAVSGVRSLVAAHPDDPDVVYGGFGAELYRSGDGGRTWNRLRSFESITALLAHSASPSTIYVAGSVEAVESVFKSEDGGKTWSRVLDSRVTVLAGSPTDASVVLAGGKGVIYKTVDAGLTWSAVGVESLSYGMASLVFDPREPRTAYAGAAGWVALGSYPGGLFKTTDGGDSWQKTAPETEGVFAVVVDSTAKGTLYVATGVDHPDWVGGDFPSSLLRSEDGGETWAAAGEGLSGATVPSLTADPHVSGTLYAGTSGGVFRTRDGGRSWTPFGQKLAGVPIRALTIDGPGRRLLAGTSNGVYDLEITRGPLDVAAGAAGESRVLVWDADHLAVGTLDGSGHWTSAPSSGASATWTAIAISTTGGERTHILWQNGDGHTALEIVGASGRQSVAVFEKRSGWIASDLTVRSDGTTDVLWSGADGRMSIASVGPDGAVADGPMYGPAPGWSAVAIADGAGGDTWVLWRSTDGRSALSVHREGAMVSSYKYFAQSDWAVEDVAVATDGHPRILRTNPAGLASVATIGADGRMVADQRYTVPGLTPRRIAAGADGQTRLLFSSSDGRGELLRLNPDNTLREKHSLPVSE